VVTPMTQRKNACSELNFKKLRRRRELKRKMNVNK
jgi:hypothetical protein